MSEIIRETDLLEYPYSFVKVDKIDIKSYVRISGDVSAFFDFCKENDIKNIFYRYSFYNYEDYIISDELLSMHTFNSAERESCSSWIASYNQKTRSRDFENPCCLELCASVGAFATLFIIENLWMDEEKAEDALVGYLEKHEEELIEFYEYDEEPSLMEELSNLLLSDKSFRFCTNKESRSMYMKQFMSKQENKRFWALTKGSKNKWERIWALNAIVHQIYNEYRNHCYKLKIQVGDELPEEE